MALEHLSNAACRWLASRALLRPAAGRLALGIYPMRLALRLDSVNAALGSPLDSIDPGEGELELRPAVQVERGRGDHARGELGPGGAQARHFVGGAAMTVVEGCRWALAGPPAPAAGRLALGMYPMQLALRLDSVDAALWSPLDSIKARRSTSESGSYVKKALEPVLEYFDPTTSSLRILPTLNRVILLSDGEATTGITSDARLVEMSAAYNSDGYALSTIGMGTDFNPTLMRDLADKGAGSFYFLEDPSAVQEVFEEEVTTFLVPPAKDVEISLSIDPGYTLRTIYGTKQVETFGNAGQISIPSLQIAHRTSVDDVAGGRRGGGGAMIAELVPRDPSLVEEADTVGSITMAWDVQGTDETRTTNVKITSSLQPGETPEDGMFSFAGVEKAFVMLNIYAGFEMGAVRSSYGDLAGARDVLVPLGEQVEGWLADNPDVDIEDDLVYINKFIDNLESKGADLEPVSPNPPNPWPAD